MLDFKTIVETLVVLKKTLRKSRKLLVRLLIQPTPLMMKKQMTLCSISTTQ